MKKFAVFLLTGFLVVLGAGSVLAVPVVIDDVTPGVLTDAEVWNFGAVAGTGVAQDVIGASFATRSVTVDPLGNLTVTFVTQNQPGGWVIGGQNWRVADFGLNVSSATVPYDVNTTNNLVNRTYAQSPFELAIKMTPYGTWTQGQAGQALSSLVAVGAWSTSYNEINFVTPMNGQFGGGYRPSASVGAFTVPAETIAMDYQVLLPALLSWVNNGTDWVITAVVPGFQIVGTPFEIIWSTARCGNDIVNANIDAQVPIPGSVLLMGSGLLGLVGLAWRRRQS
jgi:hypothetical protein